MSATPPASSPNYEISSALQPYMEFMFMDDRTMAQIAPSGDFGNTLSLNCDNPLLGARSSPSICDEREPARQPEPGPCVQRRRQSPLLKMRRVSTAASVNRFQTTPFAFVDPTTGSTYNRGFAQILRRNVEGGARQDDLQHTELSWRDR